MTDHPNPLDCWPEVYRLVQEQNLQEATALCETEPCLSCLDCQNYLGWTYYRLSQYDLALERFSRALESELANGEAYYGRGSVYYAKTDYGKAISDFKSSVDLGYTRGLYWLGFMHLHGLGVSQSKDSAIGYYQQSAAYEYLIAKRELNFLYMKDSGFIRKYLILFPQLIYILCQAAVIGVCNVNDPRLSDVPNAFKKYIR